LPIPIDRFRGSHLRFEFRHCSSEFINGTLTECDENTTFSNHALYLGLPCCKDDFNSCPNIPSSLIFQRSIKETFWISTQLSSTKLTQNVDLLALLKWKAHPDRVMDILGRLRHVSGEEIVKVFIINLLRDSKYYHFRPVMDTYIQKHFAGALAYK
ncbi:Dedicator of cytokinesis protein 3, partial [Goodea atripinnis]